VPTPTSHPAHQLSLVAQHSQCLFGFNTCEGEYGCLALGEYLQGGALEWKLRMNGNVSSLFWLPERKGGGGEGLTCRLISIGCIYIYVSKRKGGQSEACMRWIARKKDQSKWHWQVRFCKQEGTSTQPAHSPSAWSCRTGKRR